jgi:hypothetical protein
VSGYNAGASKLVVESWQFLRDTLVSQIEMKSKYYLLAKVLQ